MVCRCSKTVWQQKRRNKTMSAIDRQRNGWKRSEPLWSTESQGWGYVPAECHCGHIMDDEDDDYSCDDSDVMDWLNEGSKYHALWRHTWSLSDRPDSFNASFHIGIWNVHEPLVKVSDRLWLGEENEKVAGFMASHCLSCLLFRFFLSISGKAVTRIHQGWKFISFSSSILGCVLCTKL